MVRGQRLPCAHSSSSSSSAYNARNLKARWKRVRVYCCAQKLTATTVCSSTRGRLACGLVKGKAKLGWERLPDQL